MPDPGALTGQGTPDEEVALYRVVVIDRQGGEEVASYAVLASCDIEAFDTVRERWADKRRYAIVDRTNGEEVDLDAG